MDPVRVRFNGHLTVDEITETPDDTLTVGEFLSAVVDAHGVPDAGGYEFVFEDGEPIPDDALVEALSGETILLRTFPAPELVADPADDVDLAPGAAHLVDSDGNTVDVPDGGDPSTAVAQPVGDTPGHEMGGDE